MTEPDIIRLFQSAFMQLADMKDRESADRIADIVAAHLRSSHPMASPRLDPVGELRVNLSPDGAHVHFYVRESHFGMCLHDALGDSATVVCDVQAAERMSVAMQRVMGAIK